MIQATPQLELAQPSFLPVQEREAESVQDTQPDTNEPSTFAKILAGLTGRDKSDETAKTGTEETAELSEEVPLAENADYAMGIHAREIINENTAGAVIPKNRTGRETGEIEPEVVAAENAQPALSQQEKNILSAVDRLVEQSEAEQPEIPVNEDLVSKVKTSPENSRQATNTETLQTSDAAKVTGQAEVEKQTAVARSGDTPAENLNNAGEKAHNNAADVPAGSKHIAQQTAGKAAAETVPVTGLHGTEAQNQNLPPKNAIGERDGRSRLEETRGRDRRRASFEVHDFRSSDLQTETVREGLFQTKAGAETRIAADGTTREITLELRLPNQGQDAPSAQTTWEVRSGQAFENMLARELHQNFNNDIVRHASVLLRDANEGIIRLALKPESLGNVKIHLEMSDNKIVGHIIVDSEEALRAFEREISSLEKAFRDSGYDGAELNMSLASDGREAHQQWQAMEANRNLPWHYAASRYDAAAEQMELPLTLDIYRQGTGAVNMLA